jgi:hypothetical protein
MANRYEIALGKGPKKIMNVSFKASSPEEAEAIIRNLGKINMKPFWHWMPGDDLIQPEGVTISVATEEPKTSKSKKGAKAFNFSPTGDDLKEYVKKQKYNPRLRYKNLSNASIRIKKNAL